MERNSVLDVLCLTLIILSAKLTFSSGEMNRETSWRDSRNGEREMESGFQKRFIGEVDESVPDSDLPRSRYNLEEVKYENSNAQWVIKLAPSSTFDEWTLHHIWSVKSDEERADRLAEELGLLNLGRVDPFPSVFRFRNDPRGLGDRSVRETRIGRSVDEVDLVLAKHPSLVWASREKALVRKKRTDYMSLNDPMFDKQWHLVSVLLTYAVHRYCK